MWTRLAARWSPLVVLPVLVVIVISVGIVVSQIRQRQDTIPGSAGGVGAPAGDRGVHVEGSDATIAAWAGAAAAGDYATAQSYMENNPAMVGLWKNQHANFQQQIVKYDVLQRTTVGQTTTAVVRFTLANNYQTCITLTVNETTQRISMDRGYGRCPGQQ